MTHRLIERGTRQQAYPAPTNTGNFGKRTERGINYASAPSLGPGISPRKRQACQFTLLLQGQVDEVQAQGLPMAEHHTGRKNTFFVIAKQGYMHLFTTGNLNTFGQIDADTTLRKIVGMAGNCFAIGQAQHGRQGGRHTRLGADLPRFTGYGNCGRTDDDVVQRPDQVDQQGHRTGIRIKTKFDHPHQHADKVQGQYDDVGPCHFPIEIAFIDHPALGRHVELAKLGVDHGQQYRTHDVPGQHRLINLVPERVTKTPLDG